MRCEHSRFIARSDRATRTIFLASFPTFFAPCPFHVLSLVSFVFGETLYLISSFDQSDFDLSGCRAPSDYQSEIDFDGASSEICGDPNGVSFLANAWDLSHLNNRDCCYDDGGFVGDGCGLRRSSGFGFSYWIDGAAYCAQISDCSFVIAVMSMALFSMRRFQ